ncbi:MAG: hypothetical protein M3R66_07715 [Actinomycetota bacterium]|nr:hypothetical protein [Actinomycetota bacterium]
MAVLAPPAADELPARERPGRALWGLWICTAVVGVTGAALTLVAWNDLKPVDAYPNLVGSVAGLVYATLGAMIVRRVGNRVGWLLVGVGLAFAVICLTSAYAVVGVVTQPGLVPAAELVGAASEWMFVPHAVGVAYVLLIFPTGALPSRRWRPVATAVIAATPLVLVAFIVTPRPVALPAPGGVSLVYPNPLAIGSPGDSIASVGTIQGPSALYTVILGVALVALVVRYRSGDRELRQQIKWVAFVAVLGVTCQVVVGLAQAVCGCQQTPVTVVAYLTQGVIALVGIPVAITIAILKYGLYQIDVIIIRAVVYSFLTVSLAGVYLGSVLMLQLLLSPVTTQSDLAVAGSTLAVAALFSPARVRIQRAVDRRFYRSRYDAARTMDHFAARLRNELDPDTVGVDLRTAARETWQPAHVTLWLRP